MLVTGLCSAQGRNARTAASAKQGRIPYGPHARWRVHDVDHDSHVARCRVGTWLCCISAVAGPAWVKGQAASDRGHTLNMHALQAAEQH